MSENIRNNILEELLKISIRIEKKEKHYAEIYSVEPPEEVVKLVLEMMLYIKQTVCEYEFMNKMSQSYLKKAVEKVDWNEIMSSIKDLVNYVELNYYYEIATTVFSFLKNLFKELNISQVDLLNSEMQIELYKVSLNNNMFVRIKEHSEFDKISDFIKCRENIIKFFRNKEQQAEYLYEELVELTDILLDYENHMEDVKTIEDCKLKSILFHNFYSKYHKFIDVLELLNMGL